MHQINKLKRLHSLDIGMLTLKRKSSPTVGMEIFPYLPSLDIYLRGGGDKSYIHNREVTPKNWDGLSTGKRIPIGHVLTLKNMVEKLQIPIQEWDRQPHTPVQP